MGLSQRLKTPHERAFKIFVRLCVADALRGDSLHRGQRVFHPVVELADQQLLGFFCPAAFGDIQHLQHD